LTAAVLALLAGFLIVAPSSTAAESITISPAQGPAGSTVTATGAGWAAGWTVGVQWDDGTTLATAPIDAAGNVSVTFVVPVAATAGAHNVRFIAFVPPFAPSCVGSTVVVTFTVGAAVNPSATATVPGDATATMTATTVTGVETATAGISPTVCATSTATTTATATSTATATATATRTSTPTPTKTPVKYPPSGSGGLLDQGSRDDGIGGASLIVGGGILALALGVGGFAVLRRRPR
jgi:hypothetical protein